MTKDKPDHIYIAFSQTSFVADTQLRRCLGFYTSSKKAYKALLKAREEDHRNEPEYEHEYIIERFVIDSESPRDTYSWNSDELPDHWKKASF